MMKKKYYLLKICYLKIKLKSNNFTTYIKYYSKIHKSEILRAKMNQISAHHIVKSKAILIRYMKYNVIYNIYSRVHRIFKISCYAIELSFQFFLDL